MVKSNQNDSINKKEQKPQRESQSGNRVPKSQTPKAQNPKAQTFGPKPRPKPPEPSKQQPKIVKPSQTFGPKPPEPSIQQPKIVKPSEDTEMPGLLPRPIRPVIDQTEPDLKKTDPKKGVQNLRRANRVTSPPKSTTTKPEQLTIQKSVSGGFVGGAVPDNADQKKGRANVKDDDPIKSDDLTKSQNLTKGKPQRRDPVNSKEGSRIQDKSRRRGTGNSKDGTGIKDKSPLGPERVSEAGAFESTVNVQNSTQSKNKPKRTRSGIILPDQNSQGSKVGQVSPLPGQRKRKKSAKPKKRRKRFKIPTLKELYIANVHAGNIRRNWNPQMKPFLFDMPQPKTNARRKNIHYFDLVKTRYFLKRAVSSLYRYTRLGHRVLFVGTQLNTSKLVKRAALSCGSAYINQKWLGGVLTNWETISASIRTLLDLNRMNRTGKIFSYGKKEQARLTKKKLRLIKTIGGLQSLVRQPEVVIIIGQNQEYKAVNECLRMKTHSITVLDSDCDPRKAEMYIPANDSVKAALLIILKYLAYSIRLGNKNYEFWERKERELEQQRERAEQAKRRKKRYRRPRPRRDS